MGVPGTSFVSSFWKILVLVCIAELGSICLVSSVETLLYTPPQLEWAEQERTIFQTTSIQETAFSVLDTSAASTTAASAFRFFQTVMGAYKETVDTIVSYQTDMWHYVPRYKSFDPRQVHGMCDAIQTGHLTSSIPKFELLAAGNASARGTSTSAVMEQDADADIDGYLTQLAEACSKPIRNEEPLAASDRHVYRIECLDRLRSLVYDPRCTTRCDSRIPCDGPNLYSTTPQISTGELIAQHLGGEDTLHVLIIGAGPVGLSLANALSMLSQRHPNLPKIRILIVETRADAPGKKRPYTRNWQAHLALVQYSHHDSRLKAIFNAMMGENGDNFVLPLNAIETLLLLSTKDLGATRFLFGVNPHDLAEDLKAVSNLILVDATGHRLEPLLRGTVCNRECATEETGTSEIPTRTSRYRSPPPPEFSWIGEENQDFYETLNTFQTDFTGSIDFLEEHGHNLVVEQTEDLLYPINAEGIPTSVYWLDIHGATFSGGELLEELEEDVAEALYANDSPVCEWCFRWYDHQAPTDKAWIGEYSESFVAELCTDMCYGNFAPESLSLLREDIEAQIWNGYFGDTFVSKRNENEDEEQEDGYYFANAYYGYFNDDEMDGSSREPISGDRWFPVMGYSFNPSPGLALELEGVLSDHGYQRDPVGMPLRDFFPGLKRRTIDGETFSDSDQALIEALEVLSYHSASDWPTVTLSIQEPFIYVNGVKEKPKPTATRKGSSSLLTLNDLMEHAPMIRIGDSFTMGDGLRKYLPNPNPNSRMAGPLASGISVYDLLLSLHTLML
mmetsp:Transcript_4189/g.10125  ORF Transcript_4189/g.10125 Transcript_4189/m.10125 type:complete len:789 (+) Transcript_4189:259-2625(+)